MNEKIFPHLVHEGGARRFGRARLQQRVRDSVRAAGRGALAVIKSAGHLAGACGVIVVFGFGAYSALLDVRMPDAELLDRAVAKAHAAAEAAAAAHPSALAERDAAMLMLAATAFFVVVGIWFLVEWWQSLPFGRRAAK